MIRRFLCWLGWHHDETITCTLLDKAGNPTIHAVSYTSCRHCGSSSFF